MSFRIIRQDITKIVADAIVNTANPAVGIGGGVDSAIYEAAGKEQLLAARAKIGYLKPGDVAITSGFNSRAKYIIHSSGPWFEGGKHGEIDILRQCYDKSLQLAVDHGCKSIAFPLMATGTYGFPKELGMEIATSAFGDFLEKYDIDITLAVFGSEAVKLSGRLFDEIREYITDAAVADSLDREYSVGYKSASSRIPEFPRSPQAAYTTGISRPSAVERYPSPESTRKIEDSSALYELEDEEEDTDFPNLSYDRTFNTSLSDSFDESISIDDFVTVETRSLADHLRQLINKKHMTNSQVYSKANIKKQYFSKIMKGESFPSKQKLLCIAIALQLNIDETKDLLLWAGYAMSPHITEDKIFAWFILHEKYDILEIDYVRYDFHLPSLYEI